jgi:hypothetical protein
MSSVEMVAARRLLLVLATSVAFFASAGDALAVGGNYVIEGGSPEAQAQVRAALDRSAFDWDVVPAQVTIRITNCGCAGSRPGEFILDENVLTNSPYGPRYAWGIVQDEYAHQVDFFVLDSGDRRTLLRRIGGKAWCYEVAGLAHDSYGCERFSTLVAWAYWRSPENVRTPVWRGGASLKRWQFRALVNRLLAS